MAPGPPPVLKKLNFVEQGPCTLFLYFGTLTEQATPEANADPGKKVSISVFVDGVGIYVNQVFDVSAASGITISCNIGDTIRVLARFGDGTTYGRFHTYQFSTTPFQVIVDKNLIYSAGPSATIRLKATGSFYFPEGDAGLALGNPLDYWKEARQRAVLFLTIGNQDGHDPGNHVKISNLTVGGGTLLDEGGEIYLLSELVPLTVTGARLALGSVYELDRVQFNAQFGTVDLETQKFTGGVVNAYDFTVPNIVRNPDNCLIYIVGD